MNNRPAIQLVWKLSLPFVVLAFLLAACKKNNDQPVEPEEPEQVFDKKAMLQNMADQLIIPLHREFKQSLDSLVQGFATFKVSGTQSDFLNARKKLDIAYFRYQRVSLYGFGPGEDQGLRVNFNIFPCNKQEIQANISSGTYNLGTAANTDTKGFPALDYIFYGYSPSEAEIVNALKGNPSLLKYVDDLLADMSQRINAVVTSWNGSYRESFVNSLGTDVGSSIGFLVNQINFELDYLKNAKIATPLGLRSGGTPLPDNCEAYYGGQSLQYAIETLNIIENTYLGRSFNGTNGSGFDDYLVHLGIKHLETSLDASIKAQFLVAHSKLAAINNPLSAKVISESAIVNDAYKELVKLLVLLKTDMPSGLGVVITYQDGDGD